MTTKLLPLAGALVAAISVGVSTQSNVTGRWRAIVLVNDAQNELGLDLKADGTTVTGTITGPPVTIRDNVAATRGPAGR